MHSADYFDMPVDSPDHTFLRETAWMAGGYTEGPYLLGMLVGENLMKLSLDEYVRKLQVFISNRVSCSAAEAFCGTGHCNYLIPHLRHLYHTETDYPRMPSRNDRVETAVAYVLHNPDASEEEIAAAVGTTEKQILRMCNVTAVKKVLRLYYKSNSA